MAKLTIEDLAGDMPEQMLVSALDDDRDGFADEAAFRAALASANARAESVFGGAVPAQYAPAAEAQNATNATGSMIFHGILSERI